MKIRPRPKDEAPLKCHAYAICHALATGRILPPGSGRRWIPTCDRHVGPWTIQGALYEAFA